MDVEVLEIFPKDELSAKDRKAYQAKGNCHVKLPDLGLHVRNIGYRIGYDGKISVKPPFRVYSVDKRPAFVNSIEFDDRKVWDCIEKGVKEKIMILGLTEGPEQLLLPLSSISKKDH